MAILKFFATILVATVLFLRIGWEGWHELGHPPESITSLHASE
jgi:hypothetical protein